MGILEVLTIIFVVMKCLGHFDHSWWVVFSPLLVSAGIYVAWFAIVIFGAAFGVRKVRR